VGLAVGRGRRTHEYVHDGERWAVAYFDQGGAFAGHDRSVQGHPSLALLGADDAGEAGVISVAMAILWD
jgi:hypothetical protein